MQKLTQAGDNLVSDLSNRYNLSRDAVEHMLVAVNNGGCSMAQFNCPELGGSGQWMRGGMTMVGDMFNHGLKATVDNLCSELADGLSNLQVFPIVPAGTPNSTQWWPSDCGVPFSTGAQNNTRYAVFAGRLAVQINGQVTIYDTLNHNIGGVSQQQGGNDSLTFSSQFGTISVNQLPIISGAQVPEAANTNFTQQPELQQQPASQPNQITPDTTQPELTQIETTAAQYQSDVEQIGSPVTTLKPSATSADDIIELIAKLAKLREAGAISDQDFDTKKAELLARL